ncbi:cobalamin-dependent protein, partial [candidate division WOR-3 bacterium]|nr:cobalamin-dependent protein [candidate division WOR-3 bacterium]
MKIIMIVPSIGKKENEAYIRTWQMQPLTIAQLYSLIPKRHEVVLYDDRMESIPYDEDADLVIISIETYTARRSYYIAEKFRQRGIKVLLGGYHVTLLPEEAEKHADMILVGEAENVLPKILDDIENNHYEKRYTSYLTSLNNL